ncbi:MAG: endonuclease/exonuclease/phosphatase family protein [Propionibacteriaceae bacterium]|nr:endonuclease/exonuclease/phosphatase family protein [Propionibacteriaceae bacterium]
MRARLLLGLLLPLVACSAAPTPSTAEAPPASADTPTVTATAPEPSGLELTVMSYNILKANAKSKNYPWVPAKELAISARIPKLAQAIKYSDPDIAGLQENEGSDPPPSADLKPLLDDYGFVAEDTDVPILFRRSAFKLVESNHEYIGRKSELSNYDRIVAWARLQHKDTGQELVVFNLHAFPFDEAKDAKLRSQSIDKLLDVMDTVNPGQATPFVLLGDFNAFNDETREVYRDHITKLAAVGIVDSANVAAVDASDVPGASTDHYMHATIGGKDYDKVVPITNRHIDYIFVAESTPVASWAVVSGPGLAEKTVAGEQMDAWEGVVPSDHSPVVAKLTLG